ncbi:tautomerase family protein [Sphingobacterium sp. MYb382]|uniref:tautomerase family protein n=1 Tax=Sphingobacterium sp. MYb382 TaxID=2745278 RepID=UPI0030A853B9
MPYIQIEVNKSYSTAVKKQLAKSIGESYADIMQADVKRITVTIRELGEGSVWRCGEGDPEPTAIMMCDIRAGRPRETREKLSKRLIEICNDILELEVNQLNIEFTQHTGDEMYHQWMGHLSEEWSPDEVKPKG